MVEAEIGTANTLDLRHFQQKNDEGKNKLYFLSLHWQFSALQE